MELKNKVKYFMYVYMLELEKALNKKSQELMKISYQMDEANTDRPLKEYLKNEILKNAFDLSKCENKVLKIGNESGIDENIQISDLNDVYINNVYLPDEITEEIKKKIYVDKSGVYTEPDLCLELTDGKNIAYETVELKTTKKDSIPGSSIQQITASEWTIFVKHEEKYAEVSTGQYLFALNSKVQFPDRSPRPQVSHSGIKKWNSNFRQVEGEEITYLYDNETKIKQKWLENWKATLVQSWVDMLFGNVPEPNSWYTDCLKIFAKRLLEKYAYCTKEEKEIFIEKIKEVE